MGLRSLFTEALRASYLLTSNGKNEIIQSRDRMHLKGACFLSRQWGDPQTAETYSLLNANFGEDPKSSMKPLISF